MPSLAKDNAELHKVTLSVLLPCTQYDTDRLWDMHSTQILDDHVCSRQSHL